MGPVGRRQHSSGCRQSNPYTPYIPRGKQPEGHFNTVILTLQNVALLTEVFHKHRGENKLDLAPLTPSPQLFSKCMLALSRMQTDQPGGSSLSALGTPRALTQWATANPSGEEVRSLSPCALRGSFVSMSPTATAFTMLTLLRRLRKMLHTHSCTGVSAGQDEDQAPFQILYLLNVKDSRWAGLNPSPKCSPKHLHF